MGYRKFVNDEIGRWVVDNPAAAVNPINPAFLKLLYYVALPIGLWKWIRASRSDLRPQ